MDPSRFSTPSRVRSPVRGGVTASSRVAGSGLPLSIPVMKFHLMSAPPLGRAECSAAGFPGGESRRRPVDKQVETLDKQAF